jgi:hypothetical protein
MIAYNHTSLDNLLINEEVELAFNHNLISKEEGDAIEKTYPVNLYSPNLFIRIGLFLLTIVIVLMFYGLFLLFSISGSEKNWGIITFIFSLITYATLEFIVWDKKHYRSGIDDALLWLSLGLAEGAVNLLFPSISLLSQFILIFIITSYFLLRFGNVIMGGFSFLALLAMVFYSVLPLGTIAKTAMPFLLMAISFSVYWLVKRSKNKNRLRHYKRCCTVIEILALITLYAACNYFVVREVSNTMFDLHLKEGESVPGGWIFWIPTILLPVVYIFKGIQKRNVILLRAGLILVAAVVFTIRYYYHVAPLEIAMSIGGVVMILIAYFITKYLTPPRHGFTHAEPNDPQLTGLLHLESLVVTQTFHQTKVPEADKHFDFGGGSSGGGGATGNF